MCVRALHTSVHLKTLTVCVCAHYTRQYSTYTQQVGHMGERRWAMKGCWWHVWWGKCVCVSAVCKLTMQTIWNLQHMNVSYKNKKSVFPQRLAKRDRNAKSVQSCHQGKVICLTLFLVTTWFHWCYFIVLMSSLFYKVENSKNT